MAIQFGELIERVRHQLSGLDAEKETVAALADDIVDPGQVEVSLSDVSGFAPGGLLEVGLELMRVRAVDRSASKVILFPFGRGYKGTRRAEHLGGSEVRFNPTFPASAVAREVNGVLSEVYPQLYGVRSAEAVFPQDAGRVPVPADATGVISVWAEDRSRPGEWLRADRWGFNKDSTTTGRGLLVNGVSPGTQVRVVYATRPGLFSLDGDQQDALVQDFSDVTGLDERCADLVALGVAKRLAGFSDFSRLGVVAAGPNDPSRQQGVGASAVRTLASLFAARLEVESSVLAKEHPIRVHQGR